MLRKNKHLKAAQALAKTAARTDPPLPNAFLPASPEIPVLSPDARVLAGDKVTSPLPAEIPVKVGDTKVVDDVLGRGVDSHRGRARERELQRENL